MSIICLRSLNMYIFLRKYQTPDWKAQRRSIFKVFFRLKLQDFMIPTMENGAEITKRFYEELTGIQVLQNLARSVRRQRQLR